MKVHLLKDKPIKKTDLDKVLTEVSDIFKKHAGVTPTITQEVYDFTDIPKVADIDGDEHPTKGYLKTVSDTTYKEKGDGIDHLILLIHRDNWNLKGIWGINYSNIYSGYQLHVSRFDNKNLANSVGTMYHEIMHSLDALIATYTGENVTKLFGLPWDKFAVHGGRPDAENTTSWKYIRHKENTEALAYIAPLLRQAYEKRHQVHVQRYQAKQKELIGVLEKYIILLRAFINRKDTINR
jgi:hypothetical protein